KLEDFRGFSTLDLEFHPRLTVLVGKNGSGKTTVLDAIAMAGGAFWKSSDVRAGTERGQTELTTDLGTTSFSMTPAGALRTSCSQGFQHPFLLFYRVNRPAVDQTPGSAPARTWAAVDAHHSSLAASSAYGQLFQWLREMEDLENEQIRHGEVSVHPQLEA